MSSSPAIHRTKRDAPLAEILEALRDDGAVIVEGMLSRAVLDRMNAEIDPFIEAADPEMRHLNPALDFFFGPKTRHVSGVASKSPTFVRDLLCHPVMLGICDEILLPACARYQLNLGHVIDRGPGADAQMLHRDEAVWIHMPRPHPELQVASMTALVDFTEEIGATRVVPGSHRWPADRVATPEEVAVAEMPAGSSVLYLGSTIHGAGGNRTSVQRRALHMSYVLGWLRTEENNILATPPEVAKEMPRVAQELLGYAVHDAIADLGGYLGMLGLEDPIDLLEQGRLGR